LLASFNTFTNFALSKTAKCQKGLLGNSKMADLEVFWLGPKSDQVQLVAGREVVTSSIKYTVQTVHHFLDNSNQSGYSL